MKKSNHQILKRILAAIVLSNAIYTNLSAAPKLVPLGRNTGVKSEPLVISDPAIPDDQCWFVEGPGFSIASHGERTAVELGQTHYFYACEAASDDITATVIYKKKWCHHCAT